LNKSKKKEKSNLRMDCLQKSWFFVNLIDSEEKFIPLENGNFFLEHGTEYKIIVGNNNKNCRANATIFVDGKNIGSFRIEKNSKIEIERPSENSKKRKFTFFSKKSREGKLGKLNKCSKLGHLKVKIQYEDIYKEFFSIANDDGTFDVCDFNPSRIQSDSEIGGTALGKSSKQTFTNAEYMKTIDEIIELKARMFLKRK
jgi:hypothetical protein